VLDFLARLSSDDVFSQKDVKEVLKSLCFVIKVKTTFFRAVQKLELYFIHWRQNNARSELQDTINMTALLLRQIFLEAEENVLHIVYIYALFNINLFLVFVESYVGVKYWNCRR